MEWNFYSVPFRSVPFHSVLFRSAPLVLSYPDRAIKLVHLRHLRLKTNGEDQNGKPQKTYTTKLKHFIVKGPN